MKMQGMKDAPKLIFLEVIKMLVDENSIWYIVLIVAVILAWVAVTYTPVPIVACTLAPVHKIFGGEMKEE
jgi:hypothetical protein